MRFVLHHLTALLVTCVVIALCPDTSAAAARPRGGVSYGAMVVEQLDGRTLRLDLGPPKGVEERGVIVAQGDAATRFYISAGVYGRQWAGSLGSVHLGSPVPVTAVLGAKRPDGTYLLVELRTNTR